MCSAAMLDPALPTSNNRRSPPPRPSAILRRQLHDWSIFPSSLAVSGTVRLGERGADGERGHTCRRDDNFRDR
jgi:hypothetical protein